MVPSEAIEGPPSPPTERTIHLRTPCAVSEYTSPVELATTTPPSGPTAGRLRTYWPLTWKRHLTTPGDAPDTGLVSARTAATVPGMRSRAVAAAKASAARNGQVGLRTAGLPSVVWPSVDRGTQ